MFWGFREVGWDGEEWWAVARMLIVEMGKRWLDR